MKEKTESDKVFDAMGFEFPGCFRCRVCKCWREDKFIDVNIQIIGLSQSSVNYCNDKLSCKKGAKKIQDDNKVWMKKHLKEELENEKSSSVVRRFANFFKTLFNF